MSLTASIKYNKLIAVKADLEEALELIEISRRLFQKKLAVIKEALLKEKDKSKIEKLLAKAEKLYQEYRESLKIIEAYAEQASNKSNIN